MNLSSKQRARKLLLPAILFCVAVTALVLWRAARAAEELPPCNSTASPPLLIVLPDGTEIPAARLVYTLDARRIDIIGYARLFCDGFEVAP